MPDEKQADAPPERAVPPPQARWALVRLAVLTALCVCAFWTQFGTICDNAVRNSDWAHTLAMPVAIVILAHRRRRYLADALTNGSVWGLVLMLGGLGLLAGSTWPLSYGYFRVVAIVPVLAGIVLAIGGWRVLRLCLPMLLLVLLCIPIGQRKYASLIIKPETHTLAAARAVLDQLPGTVVELEGPDLKFHRAGRRGSIALGEPRRGASLLLAYVVIGVFVAFARLRPVWQIVVLAVAAGPLALLCNLLRLVTWGLVAIYGGTSVTSPVPRGVAAVMSLLAAYVMFVLLSALLSNLVVEEDTEGDVDRDQEVADD